LIAGDLGFANSTPDRRKAEVYDSATGTFALTGNMTDDRSNHTATLLPDGTVLIAGGATWTNPFFSFGAFPTLASAEIYHPAALAPKPVLFALSGDGPRTRRDPPRRDRSGRLARQPGRCGRESLEI
jgi:hypothetical protein